MEMLTETEAADTLGLSVPIFRRYFSKDGLIASEIDGVIMYPKTVVEMYKIVLDLI